MVIELPSPLEEREFTLKKIIARLCEEHNVEVSFMTNRRSSDIVTCVLSGLRDLVMPLPMLLLEELEQEDIEVIRSKQTGLAYLLHLVVTARLEQQGTQSPERRAKLQKHT